MFFNKKEKSVQDKKIERSTEQVLELEAQKKRLEMENEQIQLKLQNLEQKNNMKLEEATHKHKLALESQQAIFDRDRQIWEKEKQELIDRTERDKKDFEEKLKREHELTLQEAVTLTKLDAQQKIKQAELDRDRAITELKSKYDSDLAELTVRTAEESYEKFKEVFQEIQLNGDKNSQQVHEMSMKMIDALTSNTPRTEVGVQVSAPKLVEGK